MAESLLFESPLSGESHPLSSTLLLLNLTISRTQEGPKRLFHGKEGLRREKSITGEVRGHQVLPFVQIRHPGLGSLLHNHLGERKGENEKYRTQSNIFPSTFYSYPIEVCLSRPNKMFPFFIPLYLLENLWEQGLP